MIAQAQAEKDQWKEAKKPLKTALRRSPHNEEVLLYYSSKLGRRGRRKELIKLLQSEPGPLSFSLTLNLALALSQSGNTQEGKKMLGDYTQRRYHAPGKGKGPVDPKGFE